jgi:arylsulfatase A
MKKMKLFLFVFLLITVVTNAQIKNTKGKPNIIFILADDLGYGDIGCYGQQKISTPNIDALAKSGMKFTQYYSGSTVCAPARASFMTGLHTGHTAIRGNITFQPEGQFPLPDSSVTIAMQLQKAGYTTAAFGKWSLGFITSSGSPSKKGFDNFFGYNCQSLAHNYYPDHLWDNDNRIDFPENLKENTVYSADLFQQKALAFIEAQKNDKPFFLYLPYTLPHADLTPPHDSIYNYYLQKFKEEPIKITAKNNANKNAIELYPHTAYAAMVARLDKYVGEIVALVNKNRMAENTIIIFTGDNGPHQEKGGDPDFFASTGIFRGIKRDLYEGGIREPLIVSWKGKIKSGSQSNHVAALWDFFPTFQQMANLPTTKIIDGISLLPSLLQKPQARHKYLYWEFHESGGKQAVRWKNWKAIKLNVSTGKAEATELYDIEKDPSEKINIAAQNKIIVKKMEGFMKAAHKKNNDWKFLPEEK